jgi:uncharacterized protein (TIGR02598 family)
MKQTQYHRFGFSLVEVVLALGVAVFCLLSILALLPIGLSNNQTSIEQTSAASFARAIEADLRATARTSPPTDQISPLFKIAIPATSTATHTLFLTENGSAAGALDGDAVPSSDQELNPQFRATMTFLPPSAASSGNPSKAATGVRIFITWPALADRTASVAPLRHIARYETFIALDRN